MFVQDGLKGRLGKLDFSNVELGVNAGDGKIRMHPRMAEFFDGRYVGDTRIDASGDETVMSVDERIEDGVGCGAVGIACRDEHAQDAAVGGAGIGEGGFNT